MPLAVIAFFLKDFLMQLIVLKSQDERFAFSKDIQLDSVFASVKAKVHPQVKQSIASVSSVSLHPLIETVLKLNNLNNQRGNQSQPLSPEKEYNKPIRY